MSDTIPSITKHGRSKPVYAILLFSAGIFLTVALATVLTWASLEADFYGFQRYSSDERLSDFSCPPIMTPKDRESVRVKVSNSAQKEITPIVRIDTSSANVPYSIQEQFTIPPGETRELSQTVSADNIDLGYFIFAKAFRYPAYPLPSAEATCGIMVLNLPVLSGAQIYGVWLALSLLLTPLGLWMWSAALAPGQNLRTLDAARALALVAMIGLWVSNQGMWLMGVLFLAVTMLLGAAILRFVLSD